MMTGDAVWIKYLQPFKGASKAVASSNVACSPNAHLEPAVCWDEQSHGDLTQRPPGRNKANPQTCPGH
jgi:hypothetical protein